MKITRKLDEEDIRCILATTFDTFVSDVKLEVLPVTKGAETELTITATVESSEKWDADY